MTLWKLGPLKVVWDTKAKWEMQQGELRYGKNMLLWGSGAEGEPLMSKRDAVKRAKTRARSLHPYEWVRAVNVTNGDVGWERPALVPSDE